MTICVSVNVAEGLVMAADSAVTLLASHINPSTGAEAKGVLQTFNYASKVTRIKKYPIVLFSWGMASINARTIQSLVMEWENQHTEIVNYTVKGISSDLIKFISKKYKEFYLEYSEGKAGSGPPLGISVGGYSVNSFFAEQYDWVFPISTEPVPTRMDDPSGSPNFGANWFGDIDALIRLIKGKSHATVDDLIKRGVSQEIVAEWFKGPAGNLPLIFDGMPLQDAIDFAKFAIEVTIGVSRFSQGANTCGGDIDIAVIRPDGVEWAQRKAWSLKDG